MASLLSNQNHNNRYSIINFGYILQKIGKFGITRHQVFLKFVLLLPAVEQKRTAILTFFDLIQEIFR